MSTPPPPPYKKKKKTHDDDIGFADSVSGRAIRHAPHTRTIPSRAEACWGRTERKITRGARAEYGTRNEEITRRGKDVAACVCVYTCGPFEKSEVDDWIRFFRVFVRLG